MSPDILKFRSQYSHCAVVCGEGLIKLSHTSAD
jgi:hypothetical protein